MKPLPPPQKKYLYPIVSVFILKSINKSKKKKEKNFTLHVWWIREYADAGKSRGTLDAVEKLAVTCRARLGTRTKITAPSTSF